MYGHAQAVSATNAAFSGTVHSSRRAFQPHLMITAGLKCEHTLSLSVGSRSLGFPCAAFIVLAHDDICGEPMQFNNRWFLVTSFDDTLVRHFVKSLQQNEDTERKEIVKNTPKLHPTSRKLSIHTDLHYIGRNMMGTKGYNGSLHFLQLHPITPV